MNDFEKEFVNAVSNVIGNLKKHGVNEADAVLKGYEVAHELIMAYPYIESNNIFDRVEMVLRVLDSAVTTS